MAERVDRETVILTLRMLGHPLLGAQGITDQERSELRQAAQMLEDAWQPDPVTPGE